MKTPSKYIFFLLALIAVIYSGCKKSPQPLVSISVNTAALSKQLAVSLYQSLSGQYGGANISDGIKSPLALTPTIKGPRINSVNPYCGYVIDTSYHFTEVKADTIKGYSGRFKFTYACTSNVLDSYFLDDTITNTLKHPLFEATYRVTQKYFVKAIDQTYKTSSVEGAISFSAHTAALNAGHVITQYHNTDTQYLLQGVKVDISTGTADVVAGTAGFTAQIANLDATTTAGGYAGSFAGTIAFLGHRTVRVTIHFVDDTRVYNVNIVTGDVTTG